MRSTLVIWLLLVFLGLGWLTPTRAYAQTQSVGAWDVEGSVGYFTPDLENSNHGYLISVAAGRHLSTGFIVSGELGIGHTYERYRNDDEFFPGNRQYTTHYLFRLRFRYPVVTKERQQIGLNGGLMYRRYYETFQGRPIQGEYGGLLFGLQYTYDLRPLHVGLRLDTHLRYNDGLGGYIVTPFVALTMP